MESMSACVVLTILAIVCGMTMMSGDRSTFISPFPIRTLVGNLAAKRLRHPSAAAPPKLPQRCKLLLLLLFLVIVAAVRLFAAKITHTINRFCDVSIMI